MKRVSDTDLRLLRIFAAVVEARGFAAAQAELNLSVSSISNYIAALEQRLGVRLCNRGRSGFALTDKGQVIHREAQRLLAVVDDFALKAGAVRGRLTGTLRIGIVDCTVSDPDAPMTDAIRRFNRRDHDVRLEMTVGPPADLQRGVLDGHLHLAVACFPTEVPSMNTEALYDEVNGFYCGHGHPLFARRHAGLADIRAHRVVARSYWRGADLSVLGIERAAASVDIMEAQATLILSGAYVGYLPEHYAAGWVKAGRLRRLLPGQLTYSAPFALLTRGGVERLPGVSELLEDLRASRTRQGGAGRKPLAATQRRAGAQPGEALA